MKKLLSLSNITLLVALALSTVAAYYSIIGLTAIFAGAVIPIIIMGSILEVGKITTTVWLRKYWHRASLSIKMYLVPAVILLAFLTSMGIFGFLSKAHSDNNLVSGDVQAKIAVYDEKIKTARENIDANRKALKQMDEAVDQVMGRSQDEKGADKAVSLRRGQARERTRLLSEITTEQKVIAQLSEERAPIAAEVRKVEAEVGPIKYIAAFIYGDDPDTNLLEAAVRWVIILIVIVFDPLAIALVLAANSSRKWDEEEEIIPLPVAEVSDKPVPEEITPEPEPIVETPKLEPIQFVDPGEHPKDFDDKITEEVITESPLSEPDPVVKAEPEKSLLEQHPYLTAGFSHFKDLTPLVYKPEPEVKAEPIIEITEDEMAATASSDIRISSEPAFKEVDGGYVIYDGKMIAKDALKEMKPQLFKLTADLGVPVSTSFGTHFPKMAHKGDTFIRVDALPNRVFKFDGKRWFEINKDTVDAYLYDESYIKYLIAKIDNGEYDLDLLSEKEKEQIEYYLTSSK
jgi:hypothetical protein